MPSISNVVAFGYRPEQFPFNRRMVLDNMIVSYGFTAVVEMLIKVHKSYINTSYACNVSEDIKYMKRKYGTNNKSKISLRYFGYKMSHHDALRQKSLDSATYRYGSTAVVDRLMYLLNANKDYAEQTQHDIDYVKDKHSTKAHPVPAPVPSATSFAPHANVQNSPVIKVDQSPPVKVEQSPPVKVEQSPVPSSAPKPKLNSIQRFTCKTLKALEVCVTKNVMTAVKKHNEILQNLINIMDKM